MHSIMARVTTRSNLSYNYNVTHIQLYQSVFYVHIRMVRYR